VETIENLLKKYATLRTQFNFISKDQPLDNVIVYFKNEEDAFICYNDLKKINLDGKKLSVVYRFYYCYNYYLFIIYL
jgi:hypothetical protein